MQETAEERYVRTRTQLRGIAESLIAGPQYRATGTIRLAVRPNGFAGTRLDVSVSGTELVGPRGRIELSGPVSVIAEAVGVDFGPPAGVYDIADPMPADATIAVDAAAAGRAYRALVAGERALTTLASDQTPVLWPEHFDVAVALTAPTASDSDGDKVNYGVSAGDSYHSGPYAYVGPWIARTGPFWNAPFGATLPLDEAADDRTLATVIGDFFGQAQSYL
jgi:hypothetical protein